MAESRIALRIVNSANPGALGDAISAVPGLAQLARREPVDVWWEAEPVAHLFVIPECTQATGQPTSETRRLDIQGVAGGFMHLGIPITEAWARAMGMPGLDSGWQWPPMHRTQIPSRPLGYSTGSPRVLISPYSYSDNGTGLKAWPRTKWLNLVASLRAAGFLVGLLCGAADPIDYSCDFCIKGRPLVEVGEWIREAAAVITVDNGMNWMTQATGAKHVLITAAHHPPGWSSSPNSNAINIPDAQSASVKTVLEAAFKLAETE